MGKVPHRAQAGPGLAPAEAELLGFMAEHRFATLEQAQKILQSPASATWPRLRSLEAAGYVRRERPFAGRTALFLITARGLRVAGSRLARPRFYLGCFEHDSALAWLWLAARAGELGPVRDVMSERRMRSQDGGAAAAEAPVAVRLGGYGAAGRDRLHYPDLLLVAADGSRVAIELELTPKGRRRREKILAGYAADPRIDHVLYLVTHRGLGRSIQRSARQMGINDLVHVQLAALPAPTGRPSAPGVERVRTQQRGLEVAG